MLSAFEEEIIFAMIIYMSFIADTGQNDEYTHRYAGALINDIVYTSLII